MANGNGQKAVLIVFGVITAIIVPGIFFMGSNVIANDNKNTTAHVEIRKDMLAGDKESLLEINKVKEIVTDIRIEQMEQKTILKAIEKKL